MSDRPIEIALEATLVELRNGGSTVAAERSFNRILSGFKGQEGSGVWRLDFVAVRSLADDSSSTIVQPVGPIGVNLVKAGAVEDLSERVAHGQVSVDTLDAEVARIKSLPSPYSRRLTIVAAGCLSAAFSQIPGGDWGSMGIAFVAAVVGQFLRSILQARRVSAAPVTFICAALSASIASFGLRQGLSQTMASALIASVIYLAPGLPLINGFIDVTSHKYLFVGIERIANALYLFFVMALAIALAYTVIV